MKKYKFRIDKPDVSDEQIGRHKDFARLQANYQRMTKPLYKTPLYKNPKVFLVLLLILLLAYLIAEFTLDHDKKEKEKPERDSVKALQHTTKSGGESAFGKIFVSFFF